MLYIEIEAQKENALGLLTEIIKYSPHLRTPLWDGEGKDGRNITNLEEGFVVMNPHEYEEGCNMGEILPFVNLPADELPLDSISWSPELLMWRTCKGNTLTIISPKGENTTLYIGGGSLGFVGSIMTAISDYCRKEGYSYK